MLLPSVIDVVVPEQMDGVEGVAVATGPGFIVIVAGWEAISEPGHPGIVTTALNIVGTVNVPEV